MAVESQREAKAIRVAEFFMIEEDSKIVGLEVNFSDAVRAPQGAVHTLDMMRNALNSSGWVTKAVMSVPDRSDEAAPLGDPEAAEPSSDNDGDAQKD
jgi:hypothetical protein